MTQDEITTIIGKDVFVKGDLIIHSSIRIDGTLEGNLTSTGQVYIAAAGKVDGDIIARDVVVLGTVNGRLTAANNTVLDAGAALNGDLYSGKVTISEDSKFNGKCTMIKRKDLVVNKETGDITLVDLSPEEILTRS